MATPYSSTGTQRPPKAQVTFTRQQLVHLQRKFSSYVVDVAPNLSIADIMFSGGIQRVLDEVEARVQETPQREIGFEIGG